MTVSNLIAGGFALASQKYSDLHKEWTQVSWRIGGLLPNSRLMVSVQRDGALDVVLRAMEDDHNSPDQAKAGAPLFTDHYLIMLSEMWVGSVYETVRLLKERKLAPDTEEFRALEHDLRLLRIPLEKHEIAGDRKLAAPLQMRSHPPGASADTYEYKSDDPTKAHIMPSGISPRGSIMWQVLDVKANEERWVERRTLSDRFLAIWKSANASAA